MSSPVGRTSVRTGVVLRYLGRRPLRLLAGTPPAADYVGVDPLGTVKAASAGGGTLARLPPRTLRVRTAQ